MPTPHEDHQDGILQDQDDSEVAESSDDLEETDNIPQVTARKEPPPERPESIRVRTFVILSFWALVVFLGLPIWWKTTTIYRANLPLQQMMEWADGKVLK